MELPSKLLEQKFFKTRPKTEEHIIIVMDKSTLEEHLSQPISTNIKQFKIAITFLTGINGIFNVATSNNKFYFTKWITDKDGFVQLTIRQSSYELKSLSDEIRIIIDEGHFTEADNPFTIKPNFSILGSIMEISKQESLISFLPDDSKRNVLGLYASTIYKQNNLPPNPADILSFDNIFLETIIAQARIIKLKDQE